MPWRRSSRPEGEERRLDETSGGSSLFPRHSNLLRPSSSMASIRKRPWQQRSEWLGIGIPHDALSTSAQASDFLLLLLLIERLTYAIFPSNFPGWQSRRGYRRRSRHRF